MNMYPILSDIYGQLRGYHRLRIQRCVRDDVGRAPQELTAQRHRLFQARVRRACAMFPAYAAKVKAHCGALPTGGAAIEATALPVWTREDQNALFASLDKPPLPGAFAHATGGSTGEPTRFYMTRESYEWRVAVSDYGYSLAGAEEGRKSFYVWGTPIHDPGWLPRWKSDVHHWLQGRTYFDSFRFDDEQKARCCEAVNRVEPHAIVGYTGNLVELARFVREHPGHLTWRARTLVTAAEGLHPGQRELLQEVLADEVFQSYGSREFMLIGMECWQHAGYHLVGSNLMVEVVDEHGQPMPSGETGRILVTDLKNSANPFIRYEIGDLGAMADSEFRCPCGLPFPILKRVDGRIQEVIVGADGQKMTALFIPHLMKEFEWIDRYQIQQEESGRITVNLVTNEDLREALTRPVAVALRGKLGEDMQIGFCKVNTPKRNASGKTPIVVSHG